VERGEFGGGSHRRDEGETRSLQSSGSHFVRNSQMCVGCTLYLALEYGMCFSWSNSELQRAMRPSVDAFHYPNSQFHKECCQWT